MTLLCFVVVYQFITDACFGCFYCYNLSSVTSLILDTFYGPNSLLAFWLFELFLPYFIYYNHLKLELFLPILQALQSFSWYIVSSPAATCSGVLLFLPFALVSLHWVLLVSLHWVLLDFYTLHRFLYIRYYWISALDSCCLQHVGCCFLDAIASIALIE